MNLTIAFHRAALAEYLDAVEWYEQRRTGLGEAFATAVERVTDRLAAQPDFYPVVHREVREALVSGYPYCLYYRVEEHRVVVLSVFHTSRDPSSWQRRVQ